MGASIKNPTRILERAKNNRTEEKRIGLSESNLLYKLEISVPDM